MTEVEKENRRKKNEAATRKAKAIFLQSMNTMDMTNQDESSQNDMRCDNQSPSENVENEHESPHENEEIDNDNDAVSNNQSSHENEEIEHDDFSMNAQKRMIMMV